MTSLADYQFETLVVTSPKEYVYQVEMNRPQKRNAMNKAFWREMAECFNKIAQDPNCRAVVLSGAGKIFTAGLDLQDSLTGGLSDTSADPGRRAIAFRFEVERYQETFNRIEKCPKPVLAAVHSACVGGGVDMISACDIRYCTQDAWFQIKEIDLAITADVGTLQRLPKIVGNDSLVRELAYTGRRIQAEQAAQIGLVSRVFPDRSAMITGALETAAHIASMSPVAIQGIKVNLLYARDHSVRDGLDYVVTWNQGMIQTEDLPKAIAAAMSKEKPTFSKL